ncbi:hypothetical protein MCERHM31_00810 [Methylophilaceae bacterium]
MLTTLARLREPSTWAGFAVLLSVFGVQVTPEVLAPAIQGATGIAGLAAVLMREKR